MAWNPLSVSTMACEDRAVPNRSKLQPKHHRSPYSRLRASQATRTSGISQARRNSSHTAFHSSPEKPNVILFPQARNQNSVSLSRSLAVPVLRRPGLVHECGEYGPELGGHRVRP